MAADGALAKPRLRGVLHQWGFVVAVPACAALLVAARTGEARIALGLYALGLCGLLGTSAVYHRVNWRRPEVRRWMRRLDHAMIFLLVAGTLTPFAVLVLDSTTAEVLLGAVWAGALAGILLAMFWPDAPKPLSALIYVALGWAGAAAAPEILDRAGAGAVALIGVGGLLYTLGALAYARGRPNPLPGVFGYHEVFHGLVLAAAACHYAAVAIYAV